MHKSHSPLCSYETPSWFSAYLIVNEWNASGLILYPYPLFAAMPDDESIWEWWKEEKLPAGVKWNSLHHKGPLFAPPYVRLPEHVEFKYDGEVVQLSEEAEEVATFYARMLDHEYTTMATFNKNFFRDWRKVMDLLIHSSMLSTFTLRGRFEKFPE
ncbi:hypothetical protein Y032_0170g260 [Ancylostoma ceylanicum]|uniref:DNA topoisomerase I DNA binding eukaryotic-type domain-containing protein n=1 Tax=Ancylostoma ceylanicum TaxID=53326 RepID=A0A016SV51_9BILA|nr:hypothetical protein Y032_0170g260 [Ancylostoma ceylanicum]